jgi:hypothetical protein
VSRPGPAVAIMNAIMVGGRLPLGLRHMGCECRHGCLMFSSKRSRHVDGTSDHISGICCTYNIYNILYVYHYMVIYV